MSIKSICSIKTSVEEAVKDIKGQLSDFDLKMLIYFASSSYNADQISRQMQENFPGKTVFGCSTSGEISNDRMLKKSVVAMAFSADTLEDIKVEVVENIKEDGDVKEAFKAFDKYYKEPISQADYDKYVGIILMDGLSSAEEKIMDKIGDQTNCTFIGGSAGDDLKFSKTFVYSNGLAYTNTAILALLKPKAGFDIIKTQSFTILDSKLVATKVDGAARKVLEFNNLPAVEAYAEALGVPKEKAADYFFSNPVGLVADGEIYVRSPQRTDGDGIVFYCSIHEGTEVSLLQSKNIVIDTKKALESKKSEIGEIKGLINFHCILRTLELEQKNQTESYGALFAGIPSIGFSTYGEEYIGHINQTSTMLVFK